MVSANIFRPLPPSQHRGAALLEAEEEEPQLDSAWPHIQIVYEFFLRFIVSNDVSAKLAKKFIDHQFVLKVKEPPNLKHKRRSLNTSQTNHSVQLSGG